LFKFVGFDSSFGLQAVLASYASAVFIWNFEL
jgi:hypothetical protein